MPASQSRKLSTRLVARQVSELLLGRSRRGLALVPQERLAGFVFDVVLGGSIAHHPYRDPVSGRWIGVEDAEPLGRPVNATAIAHSMRLPHTTVRRRAAELVEAGLLVRSAAGFSVSPGFFETGILVRLATENAADVVRRLNALSDAGYAPATQAIDAGVASLPPGVIERLILAFSLRALETLTELYGDVTAGTIMAAITAANVRRVTLDPQLSKLYSSEDMPPPDALRVPISLRALSRAIDLPFETLRRRVHVLIARGMIVRKGNGVMVPVAVLLSERHIDNNRRIALHFEQMLQAFANLSSAKPVFDPFRQVG
jgi:DNA-binding Lrp family transcriptional regulator